jgi:hypothetical protein
MSQHRLSRHGALLRSISLKALLALCVALSASGCYQGAWRLGIETPVSTASRLIPTRDIERWELVPSTVPHVLSVKASVNPRCRYALFGSTQRVDTGQFRRVGGGWWSLLAIASGTAGGAAGGFGAAGWFSNLYPDWGRYAMMGAGAGVATGGLASCIAALVRPTKVRFAMCGILLGLGGSMLAGAGISSVPASDSKGAAPGAPGFVPLISTDLFQTLALTGASLAGAAIFSGIIAGTWRGHIDRERVVENETAQSWDSQTSEQPCGTARPMSGRTVALDITSEYLTEGVGSDQTPLKVRVALGGQSTQTVDLRPLRQALHSCGALRVTLNPDIMYETYIDEYVPPVPPDQINPASRPIHGIISPRDGVWLPALSSPTSDKKSTPRRPLLVPGISPEVLADVERRCRGESPGEHGASGPPPVAQAPVDTRPSAQAPRPSPPEDITTPRTYEPSRPYSGTTGEPSSSPYPPTPSMTPQRRPLSRPDNDIGECSSDSQQARFADCEHQCGRALDLSTCLFTFRKCHIDARGMAFAQKEHDACDLAWEQCLFKANVAPGSWRRCVDGCAQANEPSACKSKD